MRWVLQVIFPKSRRKGEKEVIKLEKEQVIRKAGAKTRELVRRRFQEKVRLRQVLHAR